MSQSKGSGVWVSSERFERFSNQGAFGQSPQQRLETHIKRSVKIEAIQRILEIDTQLEKTDRQRLEKQLKQLEELVR